MAKKQTRRSFSVSKELYEFIMKRAQAKGIACSALIEHLVVLAYPGEPVPISKRWNEPKFAAKAAQPPKPKHMMVQTMDMGTWAKCVCGRTGSRAYINDHIKIEGHP